MNLTLCKSLEDARRRFAKCKPVPILRLGSFVKRKDGSQTISITEDAFKKYFTTEIDGVNIAGIYVFWLLGDGGFFSKYDRTNWV